MMLVRDTGLLSCCLALLIAVTSGQSNCPSPCTCQGTSVTCANLNAFPNASFPETTEVISLIRASLSSIPTGAFHGLLRLRRLSLFQVLVDTVEGCALNGLNNVQELDFRQVTIRELQSYALSDLGSLGQLRLEECSVTTVQSRAIYNVSSLGALQLRAVKLEAVHSHAFSDIASLQNFSAVNTEWGSLSNNSFHNLSIGHLGLENMTVGQLGCGVLESLRQNSDTVSLTNILLSHCPCHSQLVRDAIAHADVYSGVLCTLPANDSIQSLPSACQINPDDPGVCQSDRINQIRPSDCRPALTSAATLNLFASALQLFLLLLVILAW